MKSTIELTTPGRARLVASMFNALETPTSFVLGNDKAKYDLELIDLPTAMVNLPLAMGDTSKRRHVDYDADVYRELIASPDHLIACNITDRETGKPHVVTPYRLYRAWWRLLRNEKTHRQGSENAIPFCHQSYALKLIALGLFGDDAETTDAYTDDILVQLAVFGDVIYG